MILVWFATVTTTSITPGHIKPFDSSRWVQVLIFWPKEYQNNNKIASALFVEGGEIFGQEIDTCTDRDMQNSSK